MSGRLDDIVARRPDWIDRAACRTPRARKLVAAGRADFFPERGRSAGLAREICADCPVRTECLNDALAEHGGVIGWLGPDEVAALLEAIEGWS